MTTELVRRTRNEVCFRSQDARRGRFVQDCCVLAQLSPIIIWFMANMDDKLLDEKLHLFDLNKLSLLCGACRKILQSPNWMQEACRLWGEDASTVDEVKAFCFKEVMNDILLQGEMIPPPQNGAQLVCQVSRKMPT